MRRADITAGAELYYATDPHWRVGHPARAVVVDGTPVRIIRQRCGAVCLVSHRPDPAGTAVVVDLHRGSRIERTAVPVRYLRGLWSETLAKTGRTEASVNAYNTAVTALATPGREVTGDDLLTLAASNPQHDDTFIVLRQAAEQRPIDI